MRDTKQSLVAATLDVLRERGLSGLSARAIAAAADANQALIFYHFKSVGGLVEEACRATADAAVMGYRERFATAESLTDLLAVGREVHAAELKTGRVTVTAQVLAGARSSEVLARAGKYALDAWIAEIEPVVGRVLRGTPIAEIADVPGLARAIAASFIGLELYDGVDASGSTAALDALERLGVLADVVTDLGPVARAALRRRLTAGGRR